MTKLEKLKNVDAAYDVFLAADKAMRAARKHWFKTGTDAAFDVYTEANETNVRAIQDLEIQMLSGRIWPLRPNDAEMSTWNTYLDARGAVLQETNND